MEKEQFDKISDHFFEELCRKEYVPNLLENFNTFKEKRKIAFTTETESLINGAFNGIILFSLLEKKNERIQNLIEKFSTLGAHPAFKERDIEAMAEIIVKNNLFGLEDSDFDQMMHQADAVCSKSRFSEAISMYQALTILFPTRIESWLRWGNVMYQHFFDYDKLLNIYNNCQKMFNHPTINLSIAICHVKGNELEKAKEQFKKALALCDEYDEKDLKENIIPLLNELESLHV